jgi:hypothetical protein
VVFFAPPPKQPLPAFNKRSRVVLAAANLTSKRFVSPRRAITTSVTSTCDDEFRNNQ